MLNHTGLQVHSNYTPFRQSSGGKEGEISMESTNLNRATFIGIDAHTMEHTALAINRFEEEKGRLQFDNTHEGIAQFLSWIPTVEKNNDSVLVGIEGGSTERNAMLRSLVEQYHHVYEINPLFTKQRRDYGTCGDKSDIKDAKLIAEVLTKKLNELPLIIKSQVTPDRLVFRKTVWFYEEVTERGAGIQHHIKQLGREKSLAKDKRERKALSVMLKAKEQELKRIRKSQKELRNILADLLPSSGKNLTTMPGISTVLAAKILAHTNGIDRFRNINKFIKYAGIAPLERSSGKTRKYIKANRGNRKLHAAIYMTALTQLCRQTKAKEYFDKKVSEGKTRKHALRCLMKRIACVVYGMMKSGESYRG